MKCKTCGQNMIINGHKQYSDEGTNKITTEFELICRNPKCAMFEKVIIHKNEQ